jgi:magnesium chelatase family protein
MEADFKDVRGMPDVVATVEKTICLRRNLLLCGPPGIGKTMIARRIPTIMPPLGEASLEALAVIYARANMQAPGDDEDWAPKKRPFRAPHHTVSRAGLLGSKGRPGELELATYGVLFLDELEEFPKRNLMALGSTLRQEKHFVIVIASCNPCPCGWNMYPERRCTCSHDQVLRHRRRIQELCKEINIVDFVDIPSVTLTDLRDKPEGEDSATIRARIMEAHSGQA